MPYIRKENLVYHNDKLQTLNCLRAMAMESKGDERIRQSILSKVDKLETELKERVSETTDADGSVRVRHPSVATITFNQRLEPQAKQLFGSAVKALTVFDVEIALADALISPQGVISYQPYETVARFQMSESAIAGMVTDIGGGTNPVTIVEASGYDIQPYIPDAMTNTAVRMREHLEDTLSRTAVRFDTFLEDVKAELSKGGKLGVKAADEIIREATNIPIGMASNPAWALACLGEYTDSVRMSAQLEIEAAVRLSQQKGNK